MAKVKRNVLIQGISGTIGKNLVFRQMKDGSTIVSTKQDFSNRVFSQGQLTHQSRFQEAVAYARTAAKTNPMYAELAKGTMKTAYNIALSDWFNPPVIHAVRREGEVIQVEATDNVAVAKVLVSVLDEEGKAVEQGEAVLQGDQVWEYRAGVVGRVRVEVWDFAGNVVRNDE
jgi:hypothetical protein